LPHAARTRRWQRFSCRIPVSGERLELDVPLIGAPMEIPETGQRIAFVTDNAGTIIELTEPGTWPSGRNARA
jgi:hypothetical protein